jgi:hypothetical protein
MRLAMGQLYVLLVASLRVPQDFGAWSAGPWPNKGT